MSRNLLSRLWRSLEEPPDVTAVTVAGYLAAFVAGAGLIFDATPALQTLDPRIVKAFGVAFVIAGSLGVPGAWTGRWWLERIGLALNMSILGVLFGTILTGTALGGDVHWLTLYLFVTTAGALLARWLRVRRTAYRPGTGPLTPQQKAAAMERIVRA